MTKCKDYELDFGHEFDISQIVFWVPLMYPNRSPVSSGCGSFLEIQKVADCTGVDMLIQRETR